ncbi:MAG: redox-sensing transcriptional repressor Rex [Planctomycetaceae bacterium]|nr:redox-sensing transcriptional repressor Rex [Planctomycetales bacterium]MCB9872772.1 redox-sensing transcriptional repressor Rex [Planctomycetaceae bacterium]MCB9926258.1 redox-sensing transcriptional repressor Rex [Planctomycetaceae bacterium]
MDESKDKRSQSSNDSTVPRAVVSRLSLYLRELQQLVHDGNTTTNSTQLGTLLGFTDAQVRKDLAYFGQFGYPGIGYRCEELIAAVKKILGTDRSWPVAMIGLGNLGRALLRYRGFHQQGFQIAAAFDVDAEKIGSHVEGIEVFHLDDLAEVVAAKGIRLAIVAVPALAAQTVADSLVEAGIEGVLNFAPVTLVLPDRVSRVGVDLAIELEQLAFAVVNQPENP